MDVSKIWHFLFHHLQSYYHILTILYEIFGQYNKENYQLILRHPAPAPCMPPPHKLRWTLYGQSHRINIGWKCLISACNLKSFLVNNRYFISNNHFWIIITNKLIDWSCQSNIRVLKILGPSRIFSKLVAWIKAHKIR